MHTLITGTTESGKTTIAKKFASIHRVQGFKVLVLTTILDTWDADYVTDDQEEFLKIFWRSEHIVAIMDEGGETVGRYQKAMIATATQGRHWGHTCYYLVQNPTSISPDIRNCCSQVFCFAISPNPAKLLAEDFNQPGLLAAPNLPQGEYYRAKRFGEDGRPYFGHGSAFTTPLAE